MATTTVIARGYALSDNRLRDGAYGLLGDDATDRNVDAVVRRTVELVNEQLRQQDATWTPATSEIIAPVGTELDEDVDQLIGEAEEQVAAELEDLIDES